ncbi:rhamnan synthesis F family protein [Sulfitobacter sp. HNIBRBA2951]|uniref:rhamnan synthesis F family protein n=1 Tax=Sulfitobacter aquimarinus TaxID=3158557 RepID=UPI0032DE70EF
MTPDEIWLSVVAGSDLEDTRPDFRFDPVFYIENNPDLSAAGVDPQVHYDNHGREEGRAGTGYESVLASLPNLDALIADLVTLPALREGLERGEPEFTALAYELINLGHPFDLTISDFSAAYYLAQNTDVAAAGMDPLMHFLRHGLHEGRRSLQHLRKDRLNGARVFDPSKPTCFVGVHECSRTGAPLVGLDIVKEAQETHNVIVGTLRRGPLMGQFLKHCHAVVVSQNLDRDAPFLGLDAIDKIDRGILNSVESHPFLKFLVRRDIPFASYLHEFTHYTFPTYKPIHVALFSDVLVFSSDSVRWSWGGLFDDLSFDVERDSFIVPQAELVPGQVGQAEYAKARRRIGDVLGIDLGNRRLVYGAGQVQLRKGTDMFVQASQIARANGDDTVFIWIGDGLNPEDVNFGVWLDLHLREINAGTAASNLHFIPAGEYYPDICAAADVLFLPSRLDPLPNVVFDAVRAGCEVLLFRNASGFDDPRYADHKMMHAVEYCNVAEAAKALPDLPRKAPGRRGHGRTAAAKITDVFSQIVDGLSDNKTATLKGDATEGSIDVPVLFTGADDDRDARRVERAKLQAYGRRRVWGDMSEARDALAQSVNFVHNACEIETFQWPTKAEAATPPEFSIHVHAFYPDDLEADLRRFCAFKVASKVLVTTDTLAKARQITAIGEKTGIALTPVVLPNQGRDILPFLKLFSEGYADSSTDELWCHVHLKKSIGVTDAADVWKDFLMTILLGDETRLSPAMFTAAWAGNGLVTAFDPHILGWGDARRHFSALSPEISDRLPAQPVLFPVGNMFWCKSSVAQQMIDLFNPNFAWPNEPLPNDGTIFHLIERLWPTAAALTHSKAVFIAKPDQKRL